MFNQPFIIPSLAFIVIAVPLIFKAVPRNGFYGFRTPSTMKDDETWYRANRVGGMLIMIASLLYLITAAVAPLGPADSSIDPVWWLHFVMFVGPLLVAVVLSLNFIRRIGS